MTHYAHALLDSTAPGSAALEPRWKADGQSRIGFAWFTDQIDGSEVTWHNGTTGGFSSMVALDRRRAAAVIVLANTAVAVDTVALRLLLADL
jgi:CubicO group peptidase (beta-lactamase class C family)